MRPVSVRGLLFLLGFVSFLALTLIGPHIHGADVAPSPVSANASASTAAVTPFGDAASPAHTAEPAPTVEPTHTGQPEARDSAAAPWPGDEALRVAAACVLVLLLTLVWLATRVSPEFALPRQSDTLHPPSQDVAPRGLPLPLFRLLSISRT